MVGPDRPVVLVNAEPEPVVAAVTKEVDLEIPCGVKLNQGRRVVRGKLLADKVGAGIRDPCICLCGAVFRRV